MHSEQRRSERNAMEQKRIVDLQMASLGYRSDAPYTYIQRTSSSTNDLLCLVCDATLIDNEYLLCGSCIASLETGTADLHSLCMACNRFNVFEGVVTFDPDIRIYRQDAHICIECQISADCFSCLMEHFWRNEKGACCNGDINVQRKCGHSERVCGCCMAHDTEGWCWICFHHYRQVSHRPVRHQQCS